MLKASLFVVVMFGLLAAGCATQPSSPSERAFNSCFVSDDAGGWSFSDEPPVNEKQLKELIEREDDEFLPGDRDYWFNHEGGRKMLCVVPPFGDSPVGCSAITYQLQPVDDGWSVGEIAIILCHQRP